MCVDVDIYINNVRKFFRENPKELLNLIPKDKEPEFYTKIREVSISNYEEKKHAELTQQQLLDICRELNQASIRITKKVNNPIIITTPFGEYSLN